MWYFIIQCILNQLHICILNQLLNALGVGNGGGTKACICGGGGRTFDCTKSANLGISGLGLIGLNEAIEASLSDIFEFGIIEGGDCG